MKLFKKKKLGKKKIGVISILFCLFIVSIILLILVFCNDKKETGSIDNTIGSICEVGVNFCQIIQM